MRKLTKEEKIQRRVDKIEEIKYVHKIGDVCPLTHLKINQKGKVLSISTENKAFKRRLLDMGLTKDCVVFIKQISPLGDPINISLRGYDLCVRKSDIAEVIVEVVEQ